MTCDACQRPAHGVVWGFMACLRCAAVMNAAAPIGECVGLPFLFVSCILFEKARSR